MDLSIPHLIYEEDSIGIFLLVTIALGGGASLLMGRAVAGTWRPWRQVVLYGLMIALAVRFIHFSLFDGTLLSPHYYAVDATVCLIAGFVSFRATRARQMVTQYRWINRRAGLFAWAPRAVAPRLGNSPESE